MDAPSLIERAAALRRRLADPLTPPERLQLLAELLVIYDILGGRFCTIS